MDNRREEPSRRPSTSAAPDLATVRFAARDAGGEVTLRDGGVPDDELGRQREAGWTRVLSMLAERFHSAA